MVRVCLLALGQEQAWLAPWPRKMLVSPDDGLGKRFMIGLAATIASGGPGLMPYLLAEPGQPAKADVQNAQANVTNDRY